MQGENENGSGRGCSSGDRSSPDRRCTSSADGLPGCSTVLIDSPIKSTATCRSAPPALGARSGDGKTRRYVRSSEPRLKWTEALHECFVRSIAKLGGPESEHIETPKPEATPKAILQEMNVRWLKIAHVKSHLQMYRNPKSGKSFSPRSDFSFQVAEESADIWNSHTIMEKDYQVSNSTQMQQAGSRQTYVQECDSEEASWRPTMQTRGSPIHHPVMTNVGMPTTTRLEHYSSVCSEPLAQFNHIGHSFSNVISQNSDHGEESRGGADFFKMAEDLLESRSTKSRDFETLDDVDIDRRQVLSDRILAGDAGAAMLYDSAEALAHNLLMAMRERKLLETGITQTPVRAHDNVMPEVPLELTMSVGGPDHHLNPNVRSEILTLDLTEQLNRPHL